MTSDPRFRTPGPDGPGAGTEGPTPESAAEAPDGPVAPGEQPDPVSAESPADGDAVDVEALQAKAAKADEYLALAQRSQADFENFRKRASRDAAAATQRGAMKLAKELLPAVDNLERALEHAPEQTSDAELAFVSGIRHVHSDLIAALQRAGIERYSPEGEQFDPTLHEAVAQQPFDGFEPGTVVEVFQRGYRIGESVVRPARVVVAG
jgi:molecular chaperone GrpE